MRFLNIPTMPTNHPTLDYSEITPLIFIGKNSCCTTHFDDELIARGVRSDISVEEERIDHPFGVDFFLWLPTKDHTAMTHEKADLGITTLKFFEQRSIPCYVHCKNGHGRAPMLVAAYFIAEKNMTADEAMSEIKHKRPSAHFQNVQIAFLREREKGVYACSACGFKYASKEHATQCEHACKTKGICRSDIAKHALPDNQTQ